MGVGTVKSIRKDLQKPAAVLKSATQPDSLVVFTKKVDKKGNPILTALHLDKSGNLGVNNEIASQYGKDEYENFIKAQRKAGNVIYEDKKIGLEELPSNGLQLPERGDKSDPINSIYKKGQNVNKKALRTVDAKSPTATSETAYTGDFDNKIPENSDKVKPDGKPTNTENGYIDSTRHEEYNNKKGEKNESGYRQENIRRTEGEIQGRQERINNDRAGNPGFKGNEGLGRTQVGSGHDGVELLDKKIRETMNKHGIADLKLRETSNDNAIFVESLEAGRSSNRHGGYVDGHDSKELTEAGTRTFLSVDNLAGIAVEKDGNITAAFKNSNSTIKGAVNDLIISARNHGGTKMDCYGKHLVNMYESNGYVPVARIPFNSEYVDDAILLKNKPDVYALMKNTDVLDSVIRKNSNGDYHKSTLEELNKLPTFNDYDEALKYRDDLLAKQEAGPHGGNGPKDGHIVDEDGVIHEPGDGGSISGDKTHSNDNYKLSRGTFLRWGKAKITGRKMRPAKANDIRRISEADFAVK